MYINPTRIWMTGNVDFYSVVVVAGPTAFLWKAGVLGLFFKVYNIRTGRAGLCSTVYSDRYHRITLEGGSVGLCSVHYIMTGPWYTPGSRHVPVLLYGIFDRPMV
jgi:hypothetical protein